MALLLWLACAPKPQVWTAPAVSPGPDAFLTDADFGCFRDWEKVGHSYYTSVIGDPAAAAQAARDNTPFPVGTVVQLMPNEAMVKRHVGYSDETGDWEFLKLQLVKGHAVITERGTSQVKNLAGGCAECHAASAESNDWVCSESHGCEVLPGFILKQAEKAVAKDPRCEQSG
ncbi:MAG: hypothetical protein ACI9VR_001307 [Cognaticolwellia sp.]|jgi:hypothetical protein